MSVKRYTSPPTFRWWQRLVRRLAGGQDYVAVVSVTTEAPVVVWLTGVDMRQPVSVMGDGTLVRLEPPPGGESDAD